MEATPPTFDQPQISRKYGKFKVNFKHGDVVEEKSDVLVNSIGSNILNGFNGMIGKAFVKKFKKDIIYDAKKQANLGWIEEGSITSSKIETNRFIVHWVCPRYKAENYENLFKKAIKAVFNFWEINKCSSVSFPPLGTGILYFPIGECARIFLDVIMEESKQNSNRQYPSTINIVNYEFSKHKEAFKEWEFCFATIYEKAEIEDQATCVQQDDFSEISDDSILKAPKEKEVRLSTRPPSLKI